MMPTRFPLRPLPRLALLTALAFALHQPVALAEKADREKPVNLEADRMTVDDAKKIHVYEGNVVLSQGTLVIKAARLVVTQDADGFSKGIATGNLAWFRQKREGVDEYVEGEGERIEYDGKAEVAEFFVRAKVKSGLDVVQGPYIHYDGKTENYRVDGGNRAASSSGKSSAPTRVRAVIQPKKKDGQ